MTDSGSAAHDLEEGTELQLDFHKLATIAARGAEVIPVAVQHADSREVILVAYANREALQRSRRTRIATFWSTSRNELWIKGEESGNSFDLIEIRVNCEQNSLLYLVRPKGQGICHTKNSQGMARDCYYRRLDMDSDLLENLDP
jgi:phosphoribosyl-AMP cyclohydrolase